MWMWEPVRIFSIHNYLTILAWYLTTSAWGQTPNFKYCLTRLMCIIQHHFLSSDRMFFEPLVLIIRILSKAYLLLPIRHLPECVLRVIHVIICLMAVFFMSLRTCVCFLHLMFSPELSIKVWWNTSYTNCGRNTNPLPSTHPNCSEGLSRINEDQTPKE